MESLRKRKYKDDLPKNTINKIRSTLGKLGILTVETNWKNSADGFYSVRVSVENTNLGTNGKGTTQEYALASAYGEFMERLQNGAFFKLSMDMSQEALEYKGFYYAPDEKYISIEELLNSTEDWSRIQLGNLSSSIGKKELLKKWLPVSYEDVPSDFVTLPYVNLRNNKLSYIPIKMISKMYMSNGMCAGNSVEEALVQGLSEIFERVVNKAIVKDKITPPTIPTKYIQKFPGIYDMINKIESSGNFKVIVKDCSLGEDYPVIGVIFLNKDDQTYFVKFGSHPIFEIAIERTLTELLQGQDIKNMMGVKDFSYKKKIKDEEQNLISILANGSGFYPSELFSENFSYEFNGFARIKGQSNKEILDYLIKLLEKKGYEVLVRDVSYLGFSSYHVIVPGFSEIEKIDDVKPIDKYSEYNKMKRYIRNLDNVSNKELEEMINYFSSIDYNHEASIVGLLSLPAKNVFPWYYVNIDLFITALYYKIGKFDKAYNQFDRYLNYVKINSYNKGIMTYYKCVRDYIGTRMDNLDKMDTITVLSKFYPTIMIKEVINLFGNEKEIFRRYGQLKCWNCKKCDVKGSCSYHTVEKVYKTLKDSYALNKINQQDIKRQLNL
ncbi:YcaO-like family protein [Clostridium ganghwense]|uniref:YcaO-like family protein n=1 Tax=Clostridium ganghwense TaxID=312089 RepID=A0ABT4CT53_9CLOT|nr:YcaO-like family protein [Clostridium ganghwense]MCY6371129.1 YcaO-like family protein [Clostridium ganghwense]